MKTPQHFIGCPGVLNTGMFFVVLLYTGVGFFGYLKYGDATQASITLNLPTEQMYVEHRVIFNRGLTQIKQRKRFIVGRVMSRVDSL